MGTFAGALTALVTPFRDDRVDEKALCELVERQIAEGIDGLCPCGTTGESVNLDETEYPLVIKRVVEQARGRVPVIAGTGTASTRHTIELSLMARAAGVDGLLVVAPYYNRPTQSGLEAHYRALAAAVPLPTILYNIPVRTGVDVTLATLERLSDVAAIVAVKESTNNVTRSAEIITRLGDRYTVLSGDDALTLPVMAVGGQGVISVASNVVPGEVSKLVDLWNAGDVAGARAQSQRLRPLFEALFVEANPGPIKAALAMCGQMSPEVRLPLVATAESTQALLRGLLSQLGVL